MTDNHGASDFETITITVAEVNDAPVVTNPGNQTNAEGATVSLQIQASDVDLPANTLSYSAPGLPAGLSINASSGLIGGTIVVGAATNSPYTVIVTVTDGQGGSTPMSFQWTVTLSTPGPTGLTCTDLGTKTATTTTGEKPQSKVWQYAGAGGRSSRPMPLSWAPARPARGCGSWPVRHGPRC